MGHASKVNFGPKTKAAWGRSFEPVRKYFERSITVSHIIVTEWNTFFVSFINRTEVEWFLLALTGT